MPRKTDGQKIDELVEKVSQIGIALEERSTHFSTADDRLRTDIATIRDDLKRFGERIAAVEERCKTLEKGSDRT